MQIDNKLLAKWKAIRSTDDTNKIAEKANCTSQTVRNVFKNGKSPYNVFQAMAEYYKEKEELIKSYL